MIRYRAEPAQAARDASAATVRLPLSLSEPQRAISPGQLVALFDQTSDEVLGAATILASS